MNYLPLVNTKMGTASHPRRSYGNTLPLTQLPFGMASFCLQTEVTRAWFYHPEHEFSEGVRLTHQFSPWIGDFGAFLFMPQNDCVAATGAGAWSGIRKQECIEAPHYLRTHFLRSDCTLELTPTERGGAIRLTFGDSRPSYLSLLPVLGNYSYRFDAQTNTLYGCTDGHAQGDCKEFHAYIAVRFLHGCVNAERTYAQGEGGSACMHVALADNVCEARIGISYISEQMAAAAIDRECKNSTFEELMAQAEQAWEQKLSCIEIKAKDEQQLRTFYSCLYRVFLFPHKAYELDADGTPVHYVPRDGSVKAGVRYTNNCFWDTYRTEFPLLSLIARQEYAEILAGLVTDYTDGGWLPRCTSMGEVGCMPSTLIDAIIAEAAAEGIGDRTVLEHALEGMLYHANHEAEDARYGRNGALAFVKYGYVPREMHRESVNLTQDFAYGDWCIARVAETLGKQELVHEYDQRAGYYKNLFDPSSGFMRGKDVNGNMANEFDPCTWGGKNALIAKLDELFATQPRYRVMGYGFEIHEMTEMALADFGQMAISNQPSFHLPFLYAALGETEKTEYWVKKLTEEAFAPTEKGFPGDEDTGTTAAWYILCLLGQYRLCPGSGEWIKFKPQVKSATVLGEKWF